MGTRSAIVFPAIGLVTVVAATAWAGPLTPPVGPLSTTGKTVQEIYDKITQVEPRIAINSANTPGTSSCLFKITQPGSYYLTGNIAGVIGKRGIEIATSGVTLDLNGFDMVGVSQASEQDGVKLVVAGLVNIAVVNGSVRQWSGVGVNLRQPAVTNCRVDRVTASNNARYGIVVNNSSAVIECGASLNSDYGILLGDACIAQSCMATGNAKDGIGSGSGCTISNCSASYNYVGISTNMYTSIIGCTSSNNFFDGISSIDYCTVSRCTSFGNTREGISTGDGGTISDCTSSRNLGDGLLARNRCRVINCTSVDNTGCGIYAVDKCALFQNSCFSSGVGSSLIVIRGDNNRLEGNCCVGADRGIDVQGIGNVIVRNTCSRNATNWFIAANNVVGPIIDRTVPASAAISGNSAPSSLGTPDPNANFSH